MLDESGVAVTVSIGSSVAARFPSLSIGGFVACDVERATRRLNDDVLRHAWKTATREAASRKISSATISKLPVVRNWSSTLAMCGVPLDRCNGMVARLLQPTAADPQLRNAAPLSVFCAALGARHLVPLMGYDIDALPEGAIVVRPCDPAADWFVPLGATPTDVPASPDAIVHASGRTVMSWCFGCHYSRQACLRRDTSRAVFLAETLGADQLAAACESLDRLRAFLFHSGVPTGPTVVIDGTTPRAMLKLARACATG